MNKGRDTVQTHTTLDINAVDGVIRILHTVGTCYTCNRRAEKIALFFADTGQVIKCEIVVLIQAYPQVVNRIWERFQFIGRRVYDFLDDSGKGALTGAVCSVDTDRRESDVRVEAGDKINLEQELFLWREVQIAVDSVKSFLSAAVNRRYLFNRPRLSETSGRCYLRFASLFHLLQRTFRSVSRKSPIYRVRQFGTLPLPTEVPSHDFPCTVSNSG